MTSRNCVDGFCPSCHASVVGTYWWLRIGCALGMLLPAYAGLLALDALSPSPAHPGAWTTAALVAGLSAVLVAGVVVHEAGHALAVRLTGSWPICVHLLGPPDRVTFHIGALRVGLGLRPGGQVEYSAQGLSAAQAAAIAVAGPAANLVTAPLLLLLPIPRWAASYLAITLAAVGIGNLIPARTGNGSASDGLKIIRARARVRATADVRELLAMPDWSYRPDAAGRLLRGWVLDAPEAEECLKQLPHDRGALLRVYAQEWALPRRPETESLNIVHALSWKVVTRPDVPARLADLAATRVEWVLGQVSELGKDAWPRASNVRHTLAVIRLRQGRTADVRRLCADALAADLDPADRATVLATMAMASHQRLLLASARQALAEALALDPNADLVPEAAAILSDVTTVPAVTPPPAPPAG